LFFVQAEDGIRDFHVTGVQTCALPIWLAATSARPDSLRSSRAMRAPRRARLRATSAPMPLAAPVMTLVVPSTSSRGIPEPFVGRLEERGVGKECRSGWSPRQEDHTSHR